MRDPQRIARILKKVERVWDTMPDCRFGQLVLVLYGAHFQEPESDFFNTEDTELERLLDDAIAGKRPGWPAAHG